MVQTTISWCGQCCRNRKWWNLEKSVFEVEANPVDCARPGVLPQRPASEVLKSNVFSWVSNFLLEKMSTSWCYVRVWRLNESLGCRKYAPWNYKCWYWCDTYSCRPHCTSWSMWQKMVSIQGCYNSREELHLWQTLDRVQKTCQICVRCNCRDFFFIEGVSFASRRLKIRKIREGQLICGNIERRVGGILLVWQ